MPLSNELAELQAFHNGLKDCKRDDDDIVVSGTLAFVAEPDGFAPITDSFKIEMTILAGYPEELPKVRETEGRVEFSYAHVFMDGSLCLGTPIAIRKAFSRQPSLLGFVNMLVIPYFFGFCHWKEHGVHPFGEHKHNGEGIIEYYMEALNLKNEECAMAFIMHLFEHGYRGHHDCPCGSGVIIRKCHGPTLVPLNQHHTSQTLRQELMHALVYFSEILKRGDLQFSTSFLKKISRFVQRNGRSLFKT